MAETRHCDRCGVEFEMKGDHAEVKEQDWEHQCKSESADDPNECGAFQDADGGLPAETK